MTNTPAAAYPLMLLYRLMKYAPSGRGSGIFLGHGKIDDQADKHLSQRVELARRFVTARPDLFQIVSSGRWGTEHSLVFDTEAEKPVLGDLALELMTDHLLGTDAKISRPQSDYELLAAVIALGDVNGTYGSSYWGNEQDMLELLADGINWTLYRGVGEVSWSDWGGTFGETTYSTKFGASVHPRSAEGRWEPSLDFGLEPPSIATLLAALGQGALEKIFDV